MNRPSGTSELKKRWLIGLPGAALFIGLITLGGWAGAALIAGVLVLGLTWEYAAIVFSMNDRTAKRYGMLSAAWLVFLGAVFLPAVEYELMIGIFLGAFGWFLFSARFHEQRQFVTHINECALFCFGVIYTGFLPTYLSRIQELQNGSRWLVMFFLIVWGTDTGGYFAGHHFGGPKLYPQVSPKKTRSGAWGGIAVAVLGSLLFKLVAFPSLTWSAVLSIPVLVSVASQIGDLCESLLKRAFDKKDSGSILPGHGGLLDRFDGVVFGLPVMYACIKVFG